jgi:valyl-tRNA synthetase
LLTEQGVLVEAKPYENNVGFSQRADVPIEPRLSEQWFLKYPAVEQSKACVEQEEREAPASRERHRAELELRAPGRWFHPQRWAKLTITGWRTFRTGASAVSFGGGIGFRCGREFTMEDSKKLPQSVIGALLE